MSQPPPVLALYKPYGVLSQFTQEVAGQRTLATCGLPPAVYPIGRLDADSEGLLLLSADRSLVQRLLDPERGHPRTYLVQVEGEPDATALAALAGGVDLRINGRSLRTRPCLAEAVAGEPDLPPRDPPIRYRAAIPARWLRLTLTEGKNRQVRRMTAAVGHPTLRLVRVAIGGLRLGEGPLAGLRPGEWRVVPRALVLPPGGREAHAVSDRARNRASRRS